MNPFIKPLSPRADARIRRILFLHACRQWLSSYSIFTVPALAGAVLLFFVFSPFSQNQQGDILARALEAQAQERVHAEQSIYHLKRTISEGADKPAYVALAHGTIIEAPVRIDTVETWQHNDTSLALVTSTAHTHPFRSFLVVPENGSLGVHGFTSETASLPETRVAYDEAHDIGSLYAAYHSTERPGVPHLPENATLVSGTSYTFQYAPSEGLVVQAEIDPTTHLITRERIFVVGEQGIFEMTVVEYEERTVLSAEEFENIFSPSAYPFERLSTTTDSPQTVAAARRR